MASKTIEKQITEQIAKTTHFTLHDYWAVCDYCGQRYSRYGSNYKMLGHFQGHVARRRRK